MAERALTDAQRAVVEHEDGALLVSAAAGSGKTFVLVERLLRKICDPSTHCNVDDFLIITFTKAAAAELRDRISKEIRKRTENEPENTHLRKQLSRVYLAHISTIHAFCAEILREYAYLRDFSADFRVLEETSANSFKEDALNRTMEQIYAEPDADPDRAAMLRCFAALHDDSELRKSILRLQTHMGSHPFPKKWEAACMASLTLDGIDDVSETVWGEAVLQTTQVQLNDLCTLMQEACTLAEDTFPGMSCCTTLRQEMEQLKRLSLLTHWSDFAQFGKPAFGSLNFPQKSEEYAVKDRIKEIRNMAKNALIKICQRFSKSAKDTLADTKAIAPALRGLLRASVLFDENYKRLKRKHKLLDFNDLEHETVDLVFDCENNCRTAVAREIAQRFNEIMVDEFQDTNKVQDTIFTAISKDEKNLVMVGDIKQSIYRFRLADPTIFKEKYLAFSERPRLPGEPRKILLSHNFRSRVEILDAANFVFRNVMSDRVGDVAYGTGEELRPNPADEREPLPDPAVELHLIESNGTVEQRAETEARFAAERIRELLCGEHYVTEKEQKRRICAEDIAILLETSKNEALFQKALQEAGIPSHCDREESILETTEVQTLFSCLRILDNPHQDVPLLAVLVSPVYGFGADALAAIRCEDLHTDFFDALVKHAVTDEKTASFLQTFRELREQRNWRPLEEFLGLVVQRLRLLPVFSALPDGELRCRNIRHILKHLRGVIRRDAGTLSELIRKIDLILQNPQDVSAKSGGNGVTIMTIHKSKGLEFPIVFLSELSRTFNKNSQNENIQIDSKLTLGCKMIDPDRLARYPNLTQNAIKLKSEIEEKSERMRLLYVAMTRAKERLIMTFAESNLDKKLSYFAALADEPLHPAVASSAAGMGSWVLFAAALRPEAAAVFGGLKRAMCCKHPWRIERHESEEASLRAESTVMEPFLLPDLSALDRSYDLRASRIPAKLTATQLKGRLLDEETAEHALPATGTKRLEKRERVFDPQRTELTPAEKGTALHLFMQFCDYAACLTEEGIEAEKERLCRKRFLSERQVAAVDTKRVFRFFESPLGKLVTHSDNVHREFKFSILTDADRFIQDGRGEQLLLQGVIDCYVETNDGIVLLDFKTDHIRPGQEAERAETYRIQLTVYAEAISRILRKPAKRCCLYFFTTGQAVDLRL